MRSKTSPFCFPESFRAHLNRLSSAAAASTTSSQSTISSLTLTCPVHNLRVRAVRSGTAATMTSSPDDVDVTSSKSTSTVGGGGANSSSNGRFRHREASGSDDSDDCYEDALLDDDSSMFYSSCSFPSTTNKKLMPEAANDEQTALEQFQSEFAARYGDGPDFKLTSLQDAIQQAFGCEARKRKLLAVYVHHDGSIQGNVFCSELLSKETVVSYLNVHYVCWAWDITSAFNKQKFLHLCKLHMGSGVADTVDRVKKDNFPMLILAQGRGRSCDVTAIIQGNTDLNELMAKLIKAVEDAEESKLQEIREEDARIARERIKLEQEEAYRQSLEQDRAKRLQKEEERIREEDEDRKKRDEEQRFNQEVERLKNSLPDEPDPRTCGSPVCRVRFRTPAGETFNRVFLASDPLQTIVNFVGSKGFPPNRYRILKTFPKTNISELALDTAMGENGHIHGQEMLIIEETIDVDGGHAQSSSSSGQ